MSKPPGERWLLLATSLAYLLIGFEVLFMITPFALYFYGVYGPVLELLGASPWSAWTTEFFLPHMVFTDNPLLNGIAYLQGLFVLGLLLFFVAAVPLYYGRWTGKGVVTFWLYRRLRHPQYLFLAISGFGLLLYWPRFIVLIFFVLMLFVYYLLARNEEWRMKREQPGAYEDYLARTWMFLPGEPGGRLYRLLFGWLRPRWLGLTVLFLLVMGGSLLLAFELRDYTLANLPAQQEGEVTLVSVYPRDLERIDRLYDQVVALPEVRAALERHPCRLAYLMPGDFFLTGLILQEGPRFSEAQLRRYPSLRFEGQDRSDWLVKFFRLGYKFFRTIGSSRRVYDVERFVFVTTPDPLDGGPAAAPPLAAGVRRIPALVVDVDFETHELISIHEASGNNRWGRLPMPVF
jgi:protein-S-isoprenylcysteine O-methyltransferase Ste14